LNLFTSEVVEKKIAKEVSHIYPVKNVKVRKIKVIQRPKIDASKISDMHNPEKRILTANVKKVNRRGKNIKVEDTEATNLVTKAE
jgi:small subunit ribosomal protein S3Ae